MIGVCGLDCSSCDILKAPNDPEIAEQLVAHFKKHYQNANSDWDIKVEDFRCLGCKSDRSKHWSPDCTILKCCVDDKQLEFCYECADFLCEKLRDWATGDSRKDEALKRLVKMKCSRS